MGGGAPAVGSCLLPADGCFQAPTHTLLPLRNKLTQAGSRLVPHAQAAGECPPVHPSVRVRCALPAGGGCGRQDAPENVPSQRRLADVAAEVKIEGPNLLEQADAQGGAARAPAGGGKRVAPGCWVGVSRRRQSGGAAQQQQRGCGWHASVHAGRGWARQGMPLGGEAVGTARSEQGGPQPPFLASILQHLARTKHARLAGRAPAKAEQHIVTGRDRGGAHADLGPPQPDAQRAPHPCSQTSSGSCSGLPSLSTKE